VNDGVVYEVRTNLQQEARYEPTVGVVSTEGLNGDAAFLREREECFGGFFGYEDRSTCSRVNERWSGAAEQEQGFGEVGSLVC